MKFSIAEHKKLWSNRSFTFSVVEGVLFFIVGLFINYGSVMIAIEKAGSSIPDLLLDILPVVNTDIVFSEGAFIFVIFIIMLFIFSPKIIPFTLKSIVLFIFIRSVFVIMTHLGASPDQIPTDFDNIRYISSSGADFFFSGHTGLPFLMALIFWENKLLRRVFVTCSIVAALAVLFGHLHYTIDVFSAFFISYGIYHIALKIFKKDYKFFMEGVPISQLS